MDSEDEIRIAVLAIVKAHAQTRSDYHELLQRLHALKSLMPQAISLLLQIQGHQNVLSQEGTVLEDLENALADNQPFAALLQEYATLWELPLNERIQSLKSAGFQITVK